MARFLWIGDSHLKINILSDAKSYIDQLLHVVSTERPEFVILAGDQFDSFSVVRSEILSLWTRFFYEASRTTEVIALVGNHDMAGADGGANPMEAFKAYPKVTIVDQPWSIPDLKNSPVFLPFVRDTKQFENYCHALSRGTLLFCHQSFNGAQFENGFFDPHGADIACVEHLSGVISGHVHLEQKFSNIWYPGTPFQHTFSDAGEAKGIYILNIENGVYSLEKKIQIDMPLFEVIKAETIEDLAKYIEDQRGNPRVNYKLIAKGTTSEIANFWNLPAVKSFKSNSKRVVDALTSVKPVTAFVNVSGKTQAERLQNYVEKRKWRTDSGGLIKRANELLNK